jgi:hypothetical protein
MCKQCKMDLEKKFNEESLKRTMLPKLTDLSL